MNKNFNFPIFKSTKEGKIEINEFTNVGINNLAVDKLFEKIKKERPNCLHCGNLVYKIWFKLKNLKYKVEDEKSKTKIIICHECFEKENFPVFYSKDNFEMKTLKDLIKK